VKHLTAVPLACFPAICLSTVYNEESAAAMDLQQKPKDILRIAA
jgi:hypothetical protein